MSILLKWHLFILAYREDWGDRVTIQQFVNNNISKQYYTEEFAEVKEHSSLIGWVIKNLLTN
jgi:hypothetical protein